MLEKIGDSLSGLREGWNRDRAIRTHGLFSVVAVIALFAARPALAWMLSIVILLVAGLAAELINGAIEVLLDRVHPDSDPAIGAAKDMSSAAAFVINAAAAIVLLCAVAHSFSRAHF